MMTGDYGPKMVPAKAQAALAYLKSIGAPVTKFNLADAVRQIDLDPNLAASFGAMDGTNPAAMNPLAPGGANMGNIAPHSDPNIDPVLALWDQQGGSPQMGGAGAAMPGAGAPSPSMAGGVPGSGQVAGVGGPVPQLKPQMGQPADPNAIPGVGASPSLAGGGPGGPVDDIVNGLPSLDDTLKWLGPVLGGGAAAFMYDRAARGHPPAPKVPGLNPGGPGPRAPVPGAGTTTINMNGQTTRASALEGDVMPPGPTQRLQNGGSRVPPTIDGFADSPEMRDITPFAPDTPAPYDQDYIDRQSKQRVEQTGSQIRGPVPQKTLAAPNKQITDQSNKSTEAKTVDLPDTEKDAVATQSTKETVKTGTKKRVNARGPATKENVEQSKSDAKKRKPAPKRGKNNSTAKRGKVPETPTGKKLRERGNPDDFGKVVKKVVSRGH